MRLCFVYDASLSRVLVVQNPAQGESCPNGARSAPRRPTSIVVQTARRVVQS